MSMTGVATFGDKEARDRTKPLARLRDIMRSYMKSPIAMYDAGPINFIYPLRRGNDDENTDVAEALPVLSARFRLDDYYDPNFDHYDFQRHLNVNAGVDEDQVNNQELNRDYGLIT